MKARLNRLSVEHLRYSGIYVDDPAFLVVLVKDGQEAAVYGGYIIEPEDATEGVLFRATQLLECSMVDPVLRHCTATLVSEHGSVQFAYDPLNFNYQIQ